MSILPAASATSSRAFNVDELWGLASNQARLQSSSTLKARLDVALSADRIDMTPRSTGDCLVFNFNAQSVILTSRGHFVAITDLLWGRLSYLICPQTLLQVQHERNW